MNAQTVWISHGAGSVPYVGDGGRNENVDWFVVKPSPAGMERTIQSLRDAGRTVVALDLMPWDQDPDRQAP